MRWGEGIITDAGIRGGARTGLRGERALAQRLVGYRRLLDVWSFLAIEGQALSDGFRLHPTSHELDGRFGCLDCLVELSVRCEGISECHQDLGIGSLGVLEGTVSQLECLGRIADRGIGMG